MGDLHISILGAGKIGGTLGRKWVAAGHTIVYGVTNPTGPKAQLLQAELGDNVSFYTTYDALVAADVVVVALPGGAVEEVITTHAAQLDGKIIIDTANRMGGGHMNSFATFKTHTPGAQVFRAFNSLGWENFENPKFGDVQADLFYCGPAGDARTIVERLIAEVGLRPVLVGDVDQVDVVDNIASLWFALALRQGKGRHLAFKVLDR